MGIKYSTEIHHLRGRKGVINQVDEIEKFDRTFFAPTPFIPIVNVDM